MRRRAEESAKRTAEDANDFRFNPTAEAKRAYHNLARVFHPDLALDAEEKNRRHGLMAELNVAYSAGDQKRLDKLVDDYRNSPDVVIGDALGDKLVRAIRQIFQIKTRIVELRRERAVAEMSELYSLRHKVEAEMAKGRDLLAQMAARTRVHIKKSERRLANLRSVNRAAEEYVKDHYGMDISSFRNP